MKVIYGRIEFLCLAPPRVRILGLTLIKKDLPCRVGLFLFRKPILIHVVVKKFIFLYLHFGIVFQLGNLVFRHIVAAA